MNLDGIAATNRVSYALTLQNTSLRRFPSSDRVFASQEEQNEDLFLQAPLVVGEPVVVLHTSADQTWYYVQMRNCRGWVYWSDLVFLEKSAWVSYIESTDFIVVTDASITVTPPNPLDSRMTLLWALSCRFTRTHRRRSTARARRAVMSCGCRPRIASEIWNTSRFDTDGQRRVARFPAVYV